MSDLPPEVIEDLVTLGELGDRPSRKRNELLVRLKPFNRVNCIGWDPWIAVSDTLPEEKLRSLIRGLTAAELELQWYGGSVASIIWVFRRYELRFPDGADELANWILARTENPYVPFGKSRGGARSIAEYRAHLNAKSKRHEESEQEQENAIQRKKIRAEVRKRLADERRVLQEAHSRARNELITKLRKLSPKEQLEHVAWDDFHPLAFYPASFANASSRVLQQLDKETRSRLLDKTASRRKGAWKDLFAQLARCSI